MSFKEVHQKAWSDHGEDAQGVANRLREGLALATEAKHLPALAGLAVHVHGEHLGQWEQGIEFLRGMRGHAAFENGSRESKAISCSMSVLLRCRGETQAAEEALQEGLSGGEIPQASDRARVSAIVGSAGDDDRRL